MPAPMLSAPLVRHPATPGPAIRSIDGSIAYRPGRIVFCYCVRGDMARLRVPPPGEQPAQADALWEHTCFEAFVGRDGDTGYREFNFSPSGQWAVYDFNDYRERVFYVPAIPPPVITVCLTEGRLEVAADVPLDALPPPGPEGRWRIALAAVIEAADTIDGGHSYWALRHPVGRPDFHDRAGFCLELATPFEIDRKNPSHGHAV